MRPGTGFSPIGGADKPAAASPQSTWHSPVPYLFGGLAAMLGLIAFALLVLACSYMKLSGFLDDGGADVEAGADERSAADGDAEGKASGCKGAAAPPLFEERIVVIMAGDEKPTFLGTPICRRAAAAAAEDKEEKAAESGARLPHGEQTRDQGNQEQ
ncbi:protein GLUTAMINE DUMPER 3-like [Typha angustifolia]|uniref:protein GLUTAMINE DUMPER 3-like n=1 Tax=Typha angustifolia TaxID=59011 RepID=UPI003C2F5C57